MLTPSKLRRNPHGKAHSAYQGRYKTSKDAYADATNTPVRAFAHCQLCGDTGIEPSTDRPGNTERFSWGFRGLGPLSQRDEAPRCALLSGHEGLGTRGRYWDRTSDLFRVKIARTPPLTCQNAVLAGQPTVRGVG